MRLTRALDRHLGFDRRMELVLLEPRDRIEQWPWLLAGAGAEDDLAVPTDDVVEVLQRWIERETRRRERLARELLARRVLVVAIHVRVGEHVDELVRDEPGELRDEVQEER